MFAFMKNSLTDTVFPKYSVFSGTNSIELKTLVRVKGLDGKYYLTSVYRKKWIPNPEIDPTELVLVTQEFIKECHLSINLLVIKDEIPTNAQGDELFWLDECQYTERDRLRLQLGHAIDFTKYE